MFKGMDPRAAGSSPWMRGARTHRQRPERVRGIIPADAGSTLPLASRLNKDKDHPRGCGEHVTDCRTLRMGPGSSPRMRGALARNDIGPIVGRIIPADAGSTQGYSFKGLGTGDHPRGCGEHSPRPCSPTGRRGSSPRMRGAQPGSRRHSHHRGIIPADAGSTNPTRFQPVAVKDHPRGCGEHEIEELKCNLNKGSSPRMRGAQQRRVSQSFKFGIIPADAGSTYLLSRSSSALRDHPRGCGEHGRGTLEEA